MKSPIPLDLTEFATTREDGRVDCTLCYRQCTLADGERGPCGYRVASGGQIELPRHGQLTSLVRQQRGFQVDPFLTYKPGQTSIMLGGMQCTAACTFCMSTTIVHKPDAVPFASTEAQVAPPDSLFYAMKVWMHPREAVDAAVYWGANSVTFGINEPTLSYEWTLATARIAKERGLDVAVETNGFTSEPAIRKLAPFVDTVDVGLKGSADPDFYHRRMRSAGGEEAALDSLRVWRDGGVHLIVGDLIASPRMQDEATFEDAAARLYDRLADKLGPITAVLTTAIVPPGPANQPTPITAAGDGGAYLDRIERALELAHAAGLPYAHTKMAGQQIITCHRCKGALLVTREGCSAGRKETIVPDSEGCVMPRHFCPWWSATTYVRDQRCMTCGTSVPIVEMTYDEQETNRAVVRDASQVVTQPEKWFLTGGATRPTDRSVLRTSEQSE